MELTQDAFDQLVDYTLRIELQNGKVLLYPITSATKHYLSTKLYSHSYSNTDNPPFPFLWFETVKQRNVIVANSAIARIAICSDLQEFSKKEPRYHDNFDLLSKEPIMEEWETEDGETEVVVFGNDPPQAVIYHRGQAPDDDYSSNPLTYNELEEGCLGPFFIELEGDCPLRGFICLFDDDGEENFIPTGQILVMEFNENLQFIDDDPEGEETEEDGETKTDDMAGNEGRTNNDLPF